MPVRMQAKGHVLVISKTSKARNILEIEPDALDAIARELAKAMTPLPTGSSQRWVGRSKEGLLVLKA